MGLRPSCFRLACLGLWLCLCDGAGGQSPAPARATPAIPDPRVAHFVETYCIDCHREDAQDERLPLDKLLGSPVPAHADAWEAVVRKLKSRQMPPLEATRPSDAEYRDITGHLIEVLDQRARQDPRPGHVETFRRLTRTEYQNAIRDLLDLKIDVVNLLPNDEASHGFDNITVTNLSPVLLERYISAARKISRLAIGVRAETGSEEVYRIAPDVTQDVHIPGTPPGTRGGTLIQHNFPQTGQYEIQVRLMRDRNDEIESLKGTHQIEVLIDRELKGVLEVQRPRSGEGDKLVDANLVITARVPAGPHAVAVVFPEHSSALLESIRKPLNVHYNFYRHPRLGPAVYQISIRGPYEGVPPEESPSRRRVFSVYPKTEADWSASARQILATLARRAYRREPTDEDLNGLLKFHHQVASADGFDAGIENALAAILVSPHFLFRLERDSTPDPSSDSKQAHFISPYELASRLSFFLWSSLPDDELLDLAKNGRLREPNVLESQVRRMLADKRSSALTDNFAVQWLYLGNLNSFIPDMRLYPDFDDNLRQAMRRETELFFESVVNENRSLLDLVRADYTFLNERLAKHYEIPYVYGSHFRRVALDRSSRRGGLLRQASILTVTSYATRTSPVLRGHWVLKNVLGNPPPPPPPDVPALEDNTISASLPLRARLEQHRANQACAGCHKLLDPVGFALENFDVLGRWRQSDGGEAIDSSGLLWDGTELQGVADLEQAILAHPEMFVETFAEKLMTYALGRGMEPFDAPAIRRIVEQAQPHDYRVADIVNGVVQSVPFQMASAK